MKGQSSAAETIQNQIRSGQHMSPEKENDLGFLPSCRARCRAQTSDFRSRAVPGDSLEAVWSRGVRLESTGDTPMRLLHLRAMGSQWPLLVSKLWATRLRNQGTEKDVVRIQGSHRDHSAQHPACHPRAKKSSLFKCSKCSESS